jgi:hypothetical protein
MKNVAEIPVVCTAAAIQLQNSFCIYEVIRL